MGPERSFPALLDTGVETRVRLVAVFEPAHASPGAVGLAERYAAFVRALPDATEALALPMVAALAHDAQERVVEAACARACPIVPMVDLLGDTAGDAAWLAGVVARIGGLAAEGRLLRLGPAPVVMVAARRRASAASRLVAALRAEPRLQRVRLGWVQTESGLMPMLRGFDFLVDWLPFSLSHWPAQARGPIDRDFLDLALEAVRWDPKQGPVGRSVLRADTEPFVDEARGTRIEAGSPDVFAWWLDHAQRWLRLRGRYAAPLVFVRASSSPPAQALAAPRPVASSAMSIPAKRPGIRIAVIAHVFFPDLWEEIEERLLLLPEPFDLFVTTPPRLQPALERAVRARFPGASVTAVDNRGRDILPALRLLRAMPLDRYAYVLKVHTKKSLHAERGLSAERGTAWRREILAGLVPSTGDMERLLRFLDSHPHCGIVAPPGYLYDQAAWSGAVGEMLLALLERLGVPARIEGRFAAGSMFWARPRALRQLLECDEALLDFDREAGQLDGALHHAIERAFALVAAANGYRVVDAAAAVQMVQKGMAALAPTSQLRPGAGSK